MGPLAGIKVIEMAGLGPVPLTGMMMADMGAEVFLIERRSAASAESTLHVSKRDMMRRGKTPIALDLKSDSAIELVLNLVERANVLLEGFRPGVMERLGLGPDVCMARNSALVYARLTGWGQDGPLAKHAGHDPNYIALTGTLYHSGSADQPPQAPATLLGDCAGGAAMCAWGISSALIPALMQGKGQVIDSAIVDGTAYLATFARSFYQAGHITDVRESSWMDGGAPWNRSYRCLDDKYITVCSVESKFYAQLLQRLGLDKNPLFGEASQWNKEQWLPQIQYLESLFGGESRDHWANVFDGSDACVAPVLTYNEATEHPHIRSRGSYKNIDGEWYAQPAPRFSMTQTEPDWDDAAAQSANQKLQELLQELGLSADVLQAAGIDT
ncbi:MAG: CaiB/BaiF CoA transferase family protein [Pseudomonadales bacterium]